jgi:hypothetical protein
MAESMFHGKVRPMSVFSRCGHVVCVAGEPVACYFGVYSCASVFGMFEFLNLQSTICCQTPRPCKPSYSERMYARLSAASDHDICIPKLY